MIDQERAAMQQALDAVCGAKLCEFNSMSSRREQQRLMDEATTILRDALAQQPEPVQKPVGEMRLSEIIDGMVVPAVPAELPVGTKLYTAPPQRKPLTDEEIRAHADKHLRYQPQSYEASGVFDLARAIERKVRGE